jgi:hypothetical protein
VAPGDRSGCTSDTAGVMHAALELAQSPALRGEPFFLVDYTPPLSANKEQWKTAGHASSYASVCWALFPDTTLLVSDLRYGLRWEWLAEAGQWEVHERNPDFDLAAHRPQLHRRRADASLRTSDGGHFRKQRLWDRRGKEVAVDPGLHETATQSRMWMPCWTRHQGLLAGTL